MRVRWTPRADADVQRLWLFAADRDVDRADRLERELRHRATLLAQFPRLGHPVGDTGLREMSLVNIQCVIRYRVTDDEVLILRVHHTRENRERP